MNVKKSFIDLSDIIRYIGNETRPYMEGERVYKANHIIFCRLAALLSRDSSPVLALSRIADVMLLPIFLIKFSISVIIICLWEIDATRHLVRT